MANCIVYESSEWLNKRLHHIHSVWSNKIEDAVAAILIVLAQNGLQDVFYVDRIHKHYDLNENELPTLLPRVGDEFLRRAPVAITANSFPMAFAVNDSGLLVVTCVMDKDHVPAVALKHWDVLLANTGGLQKVINTILALKMERFIGLSFRVERHFGVDISTQHMHEETLDDNMQLLLVRPGRVFGPDEELVVTAWLTDAEASEIDTMDRDSFMYKYMICGWCCRRNGDKNCVNSC